MGERHQLFVIAKRGKRYRLLAVVHHQWLYGKGALRTCLRLLRIFSHPANRITLEQELAFSAIDSDKIDKNGRNLHKGAPQPFPFVATCLYLGTVCDPARGELHSRAFVEPFYAYNQGDNNTGITVFDITDLDNPKYCYVWLSYRHNRPIAARDYLCKSYDFEEDSNILTEDDKALLDALEKFELVSLSSLKDCWPNGAWARTDSIDVVTQEEGHQPPRVPSKSLLEMSMAKLLDEILETGDGTYVSLLDQPLQTPSMRDALLSYCRRNPAKFAESSSAIAVKVLVTLLEGKALVDLSPYGTMAPDTVRSVLRELKDVRVLNLTGTLAVVNSEIDETLSAIGHDLDELCILDRPDRDGDDPLSAIRAIGKQTFTCRRLTLTSVFSRAITENSWIVSDEEALQKAKRGTPPITSSTELYGLSKSFPAIQIMHKSPGVYQNAVYEAFFLGDGLNNPTRIASGILNVMRGRLPYSFNDGYGVAIAHSFAAADSSLKSSSSLEISPLPAETFWTSLRSDGNSSFKNVYGRVRDLTPDAWTILLEHQSRRGPPREDRKLSPPIATFKIAMLRAKKPISALQDQKVRLEDIEVVDIETFLAQASPKDAADWEPALKELRAFADRVQPSLESGEELVRPMDGTEAVALVEQVFANIKATEDARESAYRWIR